PCLYGSNRAAVAYSSIAIAAALPPPRADAQLRRRRRNRCATASRYARIGRAPGTKRSTPLRPSRGFRAAPASVAPPSIPSCEPTLPTDAAGRAWRLSSSLAEFPCSCSDLLRSTELFSQQNARILSPTPAP